MSFDICPASDLITQEFGCTAFQSEWIAAWCPSGRYHSGIDLGMTVGSLWHQPVYATRAGTIVAIGIIGAGDTGFYTYLGNQAICLQTHDAYVIYAHLDLATVTVGQVVQVGQQLGLVGTRGNSTGPHLHVEVRTDGARQNVWNNASAVLDPRPYLNALPGGTASSEVIAPQEDDMLVVRSSEVGSDNNRKVFALIEDGRPTQKRHLNGAEYAVYDKAGKVVDMDAALLAAIPDYTPPPSDPPAVANLQPVLDAIHNLTLKAS